MAKNLFNSIKLNKPKRNHFDLSHDVKMSLEMGDLVPTLCMECVPGDSFQIGCESLLRFAPLVSPVMHRMNVYMHYFFVPNRILWNGWEDFITQTSADPMLAVLISEEAYNTYKLCDYLGLPKISSSNLPLGMNVSRLPFLAYQTIYNEYYRDQNLIPKVVLDSTTPGMPINDALGTLRKRAWQHDYFTGSLPFAQKGAAVDLPLGNVQFNPPGLSPDEDEIATFVTGDGVQVSGTDNIHMVGDSLPDTNRISAGSGQAPVYYDPRGSLEVEPTTINDLRRAFKLQEWLERNARAGTRYVENILGHFGVKSSDARLQRPEYITGTKSPVIISEVLNTTGSFNEDDPTSPPQGNMAGHGISVTSGKYGRYYCEEHGYIMGIMSVMPVTAYQQGIPKWFQRADPLDYYWPSFAHIGEQEVLNREIYADQSLASGSAVFGYVPRYAEYKYMPSRVAGDFKTSLDYWHLGRIFDAPPALNKDFIECNPGKRIFAVESEEDSLYAHVMHHIQAKRPMPKFGNPGF